MCVCVCVFERVHSLSTEFSFGEFQFLFVKLGFKENCSAFRSDYSTPNFSIIGEFN